MSMRTQKETESGIATYGFKEDTNTGLHSDAADKVQLYAGGSEIAEFSASALPVASVEINITGQSGTGIKSSTANPFGYDVMILGAYAQVTTEATGAATVDAGVAADAVTSNDTTFDGLDVGSAAGLFTNFEDAGTNGEVSKLWGSSQFFNVNANADIAGLVANIRLLVVKA